LVYVVAGVLFEVGGAVLPFAKSHNHEVAASESPPNCTVKGAHPDAGVAVKEAVCAWQRMPAKRMIKLVSNKVLLINADKEEGFFIVKIHRKSNPFG
jgi:hypothetical protein